MANQTLKDKSSGSTAIAWEKYLITADYLIDNPKENKNGWDYRRIETFLKFIVANSNIKPDFDLEKASLQEVVNFLRSHSDIFSEAEEHLESVVPSPELLKQLLEDWEEAQTKFNQERAANKLIETIEKISLTKKYQQIIRERLNQAVPPLIAEAIVKELPVDSQPALALKKSEELPEAQRESAVKEIVTQTQETISIAIVNLEQKIEIPPKERASLSKIQVTISDLPKIASDLSKPPAERKEIEKWLKTQFSVEESQKLAEILAPAVAAKIDFVRVSEKQIEEAVIISLAETAPELGTIPPEKISKIIAAFIPDKQDLKLLPLAKEAIPPVALDKPLEVTSLPSKFPRFFAPPLQRSSPKEALRVQDSKGKSFMEQLRQRIFTEGIDKSNALQLRSIVLESWILYLTAQNISQEDLDYTIQRLIKSGEKPNSLRIRELRELREALISFQANLPPQKLLEIKEKGKELGREGSPPVSLNSRWKTVILREEGFNPKYNLKTRFNAFINRLLGKKLVVLDSGPTVVINRLTLFTHRISESFKTIFFQTGIGQNIVSWSKILTRRNLQGLWNLSRAGGKQIFKEGFRPLLSLGLKGLKTIGETIGMAATGGLSKAFTFGGGLLRKGLGLITSGFGLTGRILTGISGGNPEDDNSLVKQILLVVIGIFILIPILFFLINTTTSTAFIEPTEISPGEIPIPIMAPLQCNSPRHLAEETICKLSQNPPPCNNQKINQNSWNSVDQCFQQIILTNKQAIRDEFNISVSSLKSLQCVGFVKGIQKALGKEITKDGNARDYLNPPYPPNYDFIQGNGANPEKGDLAIWYGSKYGHIAIVVEVVGNIKIIVAQAWGNDTGTAGNIFLSESPYGGVNDGSPNGFLKPK